MPVCTIEITCHLGFHFLLRVRVDECTSRVVGVPDLIVFNSPPFAYLESSCVLVYFRLSELFFFFFFLHIIEMCYYYYFGVPRCCMETKTRAARWVRLTDRDREIARCRCCCDCCNCGCFFDLYWLRRKH